jgi:transcriptional regulator with XRE-family HTH domain
VQIGLLIQNRRQAMEMTLSELSSRMGGSPAPSFLSKIETGRVDPSRSVSSRLADALHLPSEIVLNAAGYASDAQTDAARESLRGVLTSEAPVMVHVPVWTAAGPTGVMRPRMLNQREDVRIADIDGQGVYSGEVMFSTARKPVEGAGVVVRQGQELCAVAYSAGLEDVLGVIIRVTTELDLS